MKHTKNLNLLRYGSQYVWPILLAKIVLQKKTNTSTNISINRKVVSFLIGGLFWLQLKFGFIKSVNVLFVTSNHYEAIKDGIKYDKFISPFTDYLKYYKRSYRIARFSNKLTTPKTYYEFNALIPLQNLGLFYNRFSSNKKQDFSSSKETINTELKELGLDPITLEDFEVYLNQFLKLKKIYKAYLKKAKVNHLVIVCYYDLKSFAFIKAAHELGISSIDLQHGVQGEGHFAYDKWDVDLVQKSDLFPTHFWVWDKYSKNTIKSWLPNKKNIIHGYNKWMMDGINDSIPKKYITFTLQPVNNALPEFLLTAIKEYRGDLKWCLRIHPHQHSQIDEFKQLLKKHKLLAKVDFENASHMSLSHLLNQTKIHITLYSSVVIESYWYGIPSIVLSKKGMQYYSKQIPSHMLFNAYNANQLISTINDLENSIPYNYFKTFKTQEFGSLANKFFKYE